MSSNQGGLGVPVNLNHLVVGVKPGNFQGEIDYVLNEFISDEGRTSAMRVASDFDYQQFRDKIRDDLYIPEDASLHPVDLGVSTKVTNDSSFYILLTQIQRGAGSLPDRYGLPCVELTSDLERSGLGDPSSQHVERRQFNQQDDDHGEDPFTPRSGLARGGTRGNNAFNNSQGEDPFTPRSGLARGGTRGNNAFNNSQASPSNNSAVRRAADSEDLESNEVEPDYSYVEENTFMSRLKLNTSESSRGVWKKVCLFFNCPITAMKKTVPGISIELKDYQMYTIWRVFTQIAEESIPSYMIGDDPSLGKTGMSLAIAAIYAMLQETWYDVHAEWNSSSPTKKGKRHLGKGERGVCPSQGENRILCPCVYKGLSYLIVHALGPFPTVLFVPPILVGQWAAEASKWIDLKATSPARNIKVLIFHDSRKKSHRQYLDDDTVKIIQEVQEWSSSEDGSSSGEGYVLYSDDIPSSNIIIASSSQAPQLLKRFEYEIEEDDDEGRSRRGNRERVIQGLRCSFVIFDEFQIYKGTKTNRSEPFSALARISKASRRPPMAIGLSTSLSKGPEYWRAFVNHVFENSNEDLGGIKTMEEFDQYERDFNYLVNHVRDSSVDPRRMRERKNREEKVNSFLRHFLPVMISRRKIGSTFRYKPISTDTTPQTVLLPTQAGSKTHDAMKDLSLRVKFWINRGYQREVNIWEKNGRQSEEPNRKAIVNRRIRAISDHPRNNGEFEILTRASLFPSVDLLVREEKIPDKYMLLDGIRFSAIRIGNLLDPSVAGMLTTENKNKVTDVLKSFPFYKHHRQLTENSEKILWIVGHIKQMLNLAKKSTLPDDGTHIRHALVLTVAPISAFLTFMILWIEFSRCRNVCILYANGGLNATTKGKYAKFLQEECKKDSPIKVLICSIDDLGAGLNLQRVSSVIVAEVPASTENKEQAFSAVDLIGQEMTPQIYELYDPENLAEVVKKVRNDNRANLSSLDQRDQDEDLEYLLS
ncbi:hypothetical protein HD806DRAFT_524932 [Xylariaceae sp. AK1471]|nr:hypothetical protein HD806DRAFT_524932 [Xylariaceae sp. AK1471]